MTFLDVAPKLTERRFSQQVVDYATLMRWRVYRTHNSRHSPAGFPDLVLVRRPRVVWAELKSERGRATKEQLAWIGELFACSQEVYIWRPSDWPKVERILR